MSHTLFCHRAAGLFTAYLDKFGHRYLGNLISYESEI